MDNFLSKGNPKVAENFSNHRQILINVSNILEKQQQRQTSCLPCLHLHLRYSTRKRRSNHQWNNHLSHYNVTCNMLNMNLYPAEIAPEGINARGQANGEVARIVAKNGHVDAR